MERFIEKFIADRRLSRRYSLKAGLRLRLRRSDAAERKAESENLSQRGVFFATDMPLSKGAMTACLNSCVRPRAPSNTRDAGRAVCR
jgi:hypothetical protein